MRNIDVAHEFFYDLGGSFDRGSMIVSYGNNKYWSYGTVIGKITKDINGDFICIISDNNFSMTTSKHLGELRSACRFPIYYLPQNLGSSDFYIDDTLEKLKSNLEYYSNAKLTQKHNRQGFTENYIMLENTLQIQDFREKKEKIQTVLNEYKTLYDTLNNANDLKELKQKLVKQEREKQAKLKKELELILKKYSYLDLIEFTYTDKWFNDTSVEEYNKQKELKQKLKKYFNPKNELAFCWVSDDFIRTSKHVTVDKKEVITLLKLWKNGKLRHGMTLSHYTILAITENYIKIGCHTIPIANIQALYGELIQNQQKAA